jgi:EmrB/QacA subfamily drug resistance transporter
METENTGQDALPDADASDAALAAPPRHRWAALCLLAVVQFMISLDGTIVNVALPSVQRDLGFSASGLTWVVNAYTLAAGGMVLLAGRLADLKGRLRLFRVGTLLFGAASLCCGLAFNTGLLVGGRFLQGVGEAVAGSAALAIVALLFPEGPERARAFGIWGGLAGLGATLGVVASGLISELADWRWVFLINVVPALLVTWLVGRQVPESRPARTDGRLDPYTAVLAVVAAGGLVQAAIAAASGTLSSLPVLVPTVAGVVAAALFVRRQIRSSAPLVPLRFFAHPVRATGYLVALFLLSASAAVFFLLVLFMQQTLGYTPIQCGLAWVPFCAAFVGGLYTSFRLTGSRGPRVALATGLLCAAAGVALLATLDAKSGFVTGLLPGFVLTATGFGLANPALQQTLMHGVTEEDAGLASGASGMVGQLSGAVGLAVLVSVAASFGDGGADRISVTGHAWALGLAASCLAVGGLLAAALLPRQERTAS